MKYGHFWQPNHTPYARPRKCIRCGETEGYHGQLSFRPCSNPRNPNLELFTDEELTAKTAALPKPLSRMADAEKVLYWMARAKLAEKELERRYYDSLESI